MLSPYFPIPSENFQEHRGDVQTPQFLIETLWLNNYCFTSSFFEEIWHYPITSDLKAIDLYSVATQNPTPKNDLEAPPKDYHKQEKENCRISRFKISHKNSINFLIFSYFVI